MYNRYIPHGSSYVRISEEDTAPGAPQGRGPEGRSSSGGEQHRTQNGGQQNRQRQGTPPLFDLSALFGGGTKKEHAGGLTGMLKALRLDDLDTGDILLMLILLLLFLEGDNTELVITLGLMLLLGLKDKDEEKTAGNQ